MTCSLDLPKKVAVTEPTKGTDYIAREEGSTSQMEFLGPSKSTSLSGPTGHKFKLT